MKLFIAAARRAAPIGEVSIAALTTLRVAFRERQARGFGRQKTLSLARLRGRASVIGPDDRNGMPAIAAGGRLLWLIGIDERVDIHR
ncbi:MAG TPA: hypothetical protein VKG05_04870 [Steroidobacteraceae bacterium]|nr:hypothetical protein [Steroidobacteraceae bacterium]